MIEAYRVALVSSEIQYDTSDRALTLLPNPEANMNTPSNYQFEILNYGVLRLTYWENFARTGEPNKNTSDAHQTDAAPYEKQINDFRSYIIFLSNIGSQLRDNKHE